MYLTGTEEYAVQTVDGEYVCESPKKVLICHIPPGNPENAHTICVGASAVEAHQEHHADPIGPCADGEPEGDPDDGDEEPGDEEPGTEEPGTEEPGTEEPGTEEPTDSGTPVS